MSSSYLLPYLDHPCGGRTMTSVPEQQRELMEAYCRTYLKECCTEMVEWSETAVLRDGHVRKLADLCRPYAGHHALAVAESQIKHEAMKLVSTWGTK